MPVPVYGGVPPVAVTVTVVVPPLQSIAPEDDAGTSKGGSVTAMVVVDAQPLASVTV